MQQKEIFLWQIPARLVVDRAKFLGYIVDTKDAVPFITDKESVT